MSISKNISTEQRPIEMEEAAEIQIFTDGSKLYDQTGGGFIATIPPGAASTIWNGAFACIVEGHGNFPRIHDINIAEAMACVKAIEQIAELCGNKYPICINTDSHCVFESVNSALSTGYDLCDCEKMDVYSFFKKDVRDDIVEQAYYDLSRSRRNKLCQICLNTRRVVRSNVITDYMQLIVDLKNKYDLKLRLKKVRAHHGNFMNDRADRLANMGRRANGWSYVYKPAGKLY